VVHPSIFTQFTNGAALAFLLFVYLLYFVYTNPVQLYQKRPPMKSTLALFDLDHTLLPLDSDYHWGKFLVKVGAVPAAKLEADNQRLMDRYNAGTLNANESLPILLAPLAAHSRNKLEAWHAQYMSQTILPAITPQARALIAHHHHQGHLCALVTATNSFVATPIGAALGLQHVLATEPEAFDGQFTGRWVGAPCFKAGKITKVNEWLAGMGLNLNSFEASWFYSDSTNDMPLLDVVSHPVACNPSTALEQAAIERGWRIIKLWDTTQ
jgi:HAD superfamily hydrolase (TIGR01490 family)